MEIKGESFKFLYYYKKIEESMIDFIMVVWCIEKIFKIRVRKLGFEFWFFSIWFFKLSFSFYKIVFLFIKCC